MKVDIAIVGGGIAGMSLAAELADGDVSVAVLEQENQLAYHTSGRSAATFLESYGSPEIRALTRASRPLFDAASADPDTPALLTPRLGLWIAPPDQLPELDTLLAAQPALRRLDAAATRELCPALRPGFVAASALEADAQDLDVAGLFEHCRRRARRGGAQIVIGARVRSGHGDGSGGWRLQTDAGEVSAGSVVNASGAWADHLAETLGVAPVGLTPFRRTVAVATSDAIDRGWPLIGDVGETFYCRPEGSGLLLSPADETPSPPCDARAEVEDVALALERVNAATTLELRHVRATWAGLRTFAPDRNPVVGFDPARAGFFWLAGQGGYGMQTAPAVAVLAAALLRGEAPPSALDPLDLARLSPARAVPPGPAVRPVRPVRPRVDLG